VIGLNFIHEYAKPFFYPGNEEGCLLIHGFTGTPAHMHLLGEFLHGKGYTVSGILLPGHGTKPEDMEKTTWQDWLSASEKALSDLKKQCKKVYVVGLSMGGLLALLLSSKYQVNKVVSISTPIHIYDRLAPFACIGKYFIRFKKWNSKKVCDKSDEEYCIGYSMIPVKCVPDLLVLIKKVKKAFDKVTCPALVIQSRADEMVLPKSAEIIYNNIASKQKALMWLDHSRHVCILDLEKERIYDEIYGFLKL